MASPRRAPTRAFRWSWHRAAASSSPWSAEEDQMVDIRIATLAFLTASTPLQARVISFEIEKQSGYGRFEGIDFQRIEARVRGELARSDGVPDIDRVLAAGRKPVYETRVLLIVPTARASGALLVD